MKITFSNLGKIKKTTLDLRPLTVIIGPNNSNKTYIAYSIYGLLQELGQSVSNSYIESLGFIHSGKENSKKINKLYEFKDGIYQLKINNDFFQLFEEECSERIGSFKRQLEVFFQDSSKKIFKETNIEVEYTKEEVKTSLRKLVIDVNRKFNSTFPFSFDNSILQVEYRKFFPDNDTFLRQIALTMAFDLKQLLFSDPFLLPAERNALIITYKILEARRYDLLKSIDRENQLTLPIFEDDINFLPRKNIRYPKPIEDFLEFLTDLEIGSKLEEGTFALFANIIEKELQNRNKTNYISTKISGKEIKIKVKKGLDIDLYNASSSIKQLAPLLLYLRYRAQENDLLIIDEPEMNLHPESQAKLLEVFGMLVNAGVNVLLTTHSPYFMSHLNNLISGDTENEKNLEAQAKSLYLKDKRAFLKPEDVSAYEMKNDKLKNLKHKDYGIRWDTLSDVSADIQQKFFEIYEKGDNSRNGEEK